jgi:hypothetical protein
MANCHVDTHCFGGADQQQLFLKFCQYLRQLVCVAPHHLSHRIQVNLMNFWVLWQVLELRNAFEARKDRGVGKHFVLDVFGFILDGFLGEDTEHQGINDPVLFALLADVLGEARPYSLAHLRGVVDAFIAVETHHTFGVSKLSIDH